MSTSSSLGADKEVPWTPIGSTPLEHVHVSSQCSERAAGKVPRATVLSQILNGGKMPCARSRITRSNVPWAIVLVRPPKSGEMSTARGLHTRQGVPRTSTAS